MSDRLELVRFADTTQLQEIFCLELETLSQRGPDYWSAYHAPLRACCDLATELGANAAVIQRQVLDPDYFSEYIAYYSRQFKNVTRYCTRIHLFSRVSPAGEIVLDYLDNPATEGDYLGFVTLRPIPRTPIGASVLKAPPKRGFICCIEDFPVHLAGRELQLKGTPFMQQDNAVGACAQASIWMAFRTIRKKEGERAYDPAQITGAATRFSVTGRILPNRQGLTCTQVIEAIRSAGYSPHLVLFPKNTNFSPGDKLDADELSKARLVLHAYVESGLPVLLILYPKGGGHAVVVIGHTFSGIRAQNDEIAFSLTAGAVSIAHAVSWIPQFVIHNDNSGPYMPLLQTATPGTAYALDQAYGAVPLLPADVFVSGEEALEYAKKLWQDILEEWTVAMAHQDAEDLCNKFALRLLLLDKRKIRSWALQYSTAPEVREQLRLAHLPRRVWILELNLKDTYGEHAMGKAATLVGFILIDPTADDAASALLMTYFNAPAISDTKFGSLVLASEDDPKVLQIKPAAPMVPFRDL